LKSTPSPSRTEKPKHSVASKRRRRSRGGGMHLFNFGLEQRSYIEIANGRPSLTNLVEAVPETAGACQKVRVLLVQSSEKRNAQREERN